MAGLEAHHGFGDRLVERAGGLVGGEIAGDDQALAQQVVVRRPATPIANLASAGIVGQPPRTARSE